MIDASRQHIIHIIVRCSGRYICIHVDEEFASTTNYLFDNYLFDKKHMGLI